MPSDNTHVVVQIPNVGRVAFPATMSQDQILLQVQRLSGDAAAQREQERLSGPPLSADSANRFVQGLAQTLNPFAAVSAAAHAVVPESVARFAGAERPETYGPLNTASALLRAQGEQFNKAKTAQSIPEKVGYVAAGALPLVGPAAAHAGERIASGDVAGGLGETTGLLAPSLVSGALSVKNRPNPTAATAMERQAVEDVANQVLNPSNAKMRGIARNTAAPEMLKKSSGYTGDRMMDTLHAEDMMDAAVTKIDNAIQDAGGGQTLVETQPILDALQQKLDSLMTTGQEMVNGRMTKTRVPMKGLKGRAEHLQQVIEEIQNVSEMDNTGTLSASFDELKPLRDNYYAQAKEAGAYRRMGNVSLDDAGWASREGGTSIQDAFADTVPGLADANREYHVHKSIHDVLNPFGGNPRTFKNSQGQTGGLATVGFSLGQHFGKAGAFIGSKVWPQLVEIMNSPKFRFVSAQNKMELAQAIRSGQPGRLQRAIFNATRAIQAGSATAAAQEQQ